MLNNNQEVQKYYTDISEVIRHQNLQILREQRMKFETALSEIPDLDLKQKEINDAFKKLIIIRGLKSDLYDVEQEIKTLDDPTAQVKQQEELDSTILIIEQLEANLHVALEEIIPFRLQMEEYVHSISRNHLQEIRALKSPPDPIVQVLSAIEQLTGNVLATFQNNDRRGRQRRTQLDPQAYLNALLNLDFDNISRAKVDSARTLFNNTTEERTRTVSYGARGLYQWLQVFFQMHAISSSQNAPARAQLQVSIAKRDEILNLQQKTAQKLQTLLSDKQNLETQIKEMQDQQQFTENEHTQLIWLISTNQLMIDLEHRLKDNSKSETQQLNESKSIDLDHLSFDDTPAHQLMLRLFKVNIRISQESQAYEENYSLFNQLADIETKKQKQISSLQFTIESEQKQITDSENIIKELNVNQQRIANEIKVANQEIKLSQQKLKEISQKLSQPVNPKLKSQHILKIKSQDPSKSTYMLIKLVLLSLNKGDQSWNEFMHNGSQIYLSMKTRKLQEYNLSSILEIKQKMLNDSQYSKNTPQFFLSGWLKLLVKNLDTFQEYDDEKQNLKQLQDKLQKLQEEQVYFKQLLDQEQQSLKTLKLSLEANQVVIKKIMGSCNSRVDFFQSYLVKYHDDYINYFKMVRSYTMKTILQLFHKQASIQWISIIIQILEYNTFSSQILEFVYNYTIQDVKSDFKKQDVKQLEDKYQAVYEQFRDFEVLKEAKYYCNIEKNLQRFLIEYCYKFQEIKRSYELLVQK